MPHRLDHRACIELGDKICALYPRERVPNALCCCYVDAHLKLTSLHLVKVISLVE